MVSTYMFKRVRNLVKLKKSDRAIALELGIDRKTVAKYRGSNTPPQYKKRVRESRGDPLDDHMETIRAMLKLVDDLPAADIFLTLKDEHGYQGCLRTVQRRVGEIRDEQPKARFFEQEYSLAEQAQFDFKEKVRIPFAEGERVVYLHFSTLPYSGHFSIRAYPSPNFEAFMDGVHRFFESIGGMTENVRFDNLSPVVKKVLKGSARIYTDAFNKALDYYGFGPLPCAPAAGWEKGDVEREIKTQAKRLTRRIKLKGKVFQDFDDFNEWIARYCEYFQTDKSKKLLAEEKKHLKPLPPYREEIVCKVDVASPTPYGTVRVAKSTYSVPDNLIEVPCRIVMGPYDVKIQRAGAKGATGMVKHPRVAGGSSILLEHVVPSLLRKPRAMIRWRHREILFPIPPFKRFYEKLAAISELPGDAEREFLKTVNLVQHASLAEIALGIEIAMDAGSVSFDEIRSLVLVDGHRPADISDPRYSQIPLKPEMSQYDNLIPDLKEAHSA